MIHGLEGTLSRVSGSVPEFSATIGELETGWFPAADFGDPTRDRLADALERVAVSYPGADKRTQAALFMNQYAWVLSGAAAIAFLLEKRVPDFALNNVALRYNTVSWEEDGESGKYERLEVRFLSGRFAALPDDKAAELPDVTVLPDATALREWFRVRVEEHMQPIIDRAHIASHLSRGALWRIVADSCAQAFLYTGKQVGEAAQAEREGLAFVKVPGSPLNNPQLHFVSLTCDGHSETFRARGGCCRYYTLPDGHTCTTCVLHDPEARKADFMAALKQRAARAEA